MKKVFLVLMMVCILTASHAQESKETPENNKIQQIQLAVKLAEFGYANYAPLALIQAAQILNDVEVGKLEADPKTVEGDGVATTKVEKPELSVQQLLNDAKAFAAGDSHIEALIASVHPNGETRGAVNGPYIKTDNVKANTTDIYRINFYGGRVAEVLVSGDGDTDLDLYIYDENGNLIDSDTDYSDDCYCSWYPKWTGAFKIKIVNRGNVYNRYTMYVN